MRLVLSIMSRIIRDPMVQLLLLLLASLSCGPLVESEYMNSISENNSYVFYSAVWASVYLIPSSIGAILARIALNNGKNLATILISALSICMAISAILSLVMINSELYHALLGFKAWWKDVYTSIEIIIAFVVGGNGLNYLVNMDHMHDNRVRPCSHADLDHWTGKYK